MSKLVISSIGPASSVQDAGRPGFQRYGLTPSGPMDRLALAAANALLGNPPFTATVEIGPFGASFTAEGAVRVALAGAVRTADIAGRPVTFDSSVTLADGQTLTLGFARSGTFSYLAIEGGIQGEPTFGSVAVNARAGLGSPYPRPLQNGDELQAAIASGVAEQRLELPTMPENAPIRVIWGPQDDEFADEARQQFIDGDWKISATSDRMGYRLEGPVIKHLHGHNIVTDGTVNGSIQVPGNGQPIVLMTDRATTGGYPKIASVISADLGRFAQIPAGRVFRFKAIGIVEAQAEARKFAELLRTLPDRMRPVETLDLNIEALGDANVAGHAVSAVDAGTWQVPSPATNSSKVSLRQVDK